MARKEGEGKIKKLSFKEGKIDIVFLSFVLVLLTLGLVMLFSASYAYSYTYYDNSFHFILRQTAFAAVGLVAMFFTSRIDYHFYKKFSWVLYAVCLAMLVFLFFIVKCLLIIHILPTIYKMYINNISTQFRTFQVIV